MTRRPGLLLSLARGAYDRANTPLAQAAAHGALLGTLFRCREVYYDQAAREKEEARRERMYAMRGRCMPGDETWGGRAI